jgi:type II secretory pathway pseudopilin PulG
MNPFEMVVLIILISAVAGTLSSYLKRRDRAVQADTDALVRDNDRMAAEMKELKGRIATLERIATDAPTRLTAEIEALRDQKTN